MYKCCGHCDELQKLTAASEEDFKKFMMTWDGLWGDDVDNLQLYQQQQHLHQRHDTYLCSSSEYKEEGQTEPFISDYEIHYNRNSVLSIAPKTLLPMIVSQVDQPTQ